jgi:hypothetical protein
LLSKTVSAFNNL